MERPRTPRPAKSAGTIAALLAAQAGLEARARGDSTPLHMAAALRHP